VSHRKSIFYIKNKPIDIKSFVIKEYFLKLTQIGLPKKKSDAMKSLIIISRVRSFIFWTTYAWSLMNERTRPLGSVRQFGRDEWGWDDNCRVLFYLLPFMGLLQVP